MIRQAISCDICGTEKKQTNHWFVAWEQGGELRVSGWNSRNRLRTGSMHLCGQACLHKLADEFMARVIAGKSGSKPVEDFSAEPATEADTSLAAAPAPIDIESSARLLPVAPVEPAWPRPPLRAGAGLSAVPERTRGEDLTALPGEPPRFDPRNRRAAAWERERERTQGPGELRPTIVPRRISGLRD